MAQIDQFSNIIELNPEDNRIIKADFTLKLQGYIIPENIQKELKKQSSKIFGVSSINIKTSLNG